MSCSPGPPQLDDSTLRATTNEVPAVKEGWLQERGRTPPDQGPETGPNTCVVGCLRGTTGIERTLHGDSPEGAACPLGSQ
ncbi:hypothetical protein CB1_001776011 [Camelus ferus]|nr:hypothetical protein CB1_001776011 [Camelus ferus]